MPVHWPIRRAEARCPGDQRITPESGRGPGTQIADAPENRRRTRSSVAENDGGARRRAGRSCILRSAPGARTGGRSRVPAEVGHRDGGRANGAEIDHRHRGGRRVHAGTGDAPGHGSGEGEVARQDRPRPRPVSAWPVYKSLGRVRRAGDAPSEFRHACVFSPAPSQGRPPGWAAISCRLLSLLTGEAGAVRDGPRRLGNGRAGTWSWSAA